MVELEVLVSCKRLESVTGQNGSALWLLGLREQDLMKEERLLTQAALTANPSPARVEPQLQLVLSHPVLSPICPRSQPVSSPLLFNFSTD